LGVNGRDRRYKERLRDEPSDAGFIATESSSARLRLASNAAAESLATFVISIPASDGARLRGRSLDAIGWPSSSSRGTCPIRATREGYSSPINARYAKRPLTAGEVAVYAPPRPCAHSSTVAQRPVSILEDDFSFVDAGSLPTRIAAILMPACAGTDQAVRFRNQAHHAAPPAGDVDIVNYAAANRRHGGLLVTRRGAELILARSNVFRPIDEDTKYYWSWRSGSIR